MKVNSPRLAGMLGLAFALTALVGVWAAYDRPQAWARFALLAAGLALMAAIAWAGSRWGEAALGPVALACAALAAVVGVYYLSGADWQSGAGAKLDALRQIGLWLQARRPAVALPEDIHPNVAGSALAVLLPLGAGGSVWAWNRGRRALGVAAALACLVATGALLLTASRGAWLGLAAGGVVALLVHLTPPGRSSKIVRYAALMLVLLLVVAPLLAAITAGPSLERFFGSVSTPGLALSRPVIWRDALALIGDTPFTGSGLGSTAMIYSSYALLIHAPYISQMHNLFLQVGMEQGLPGVIVFLALLVLAFWGLVADPERGRPADALWLASLASLVALAVHGVVDAALYGSRTVLVFFLPLGMALAQARPAAWSGSAGWPAVGLGLAALAAVLLFPAVRGAFEANLGAVTQARAELAAFRPPETPIQDVLRRDGKVDLAPAEARYRAALALDPTNVTANRRLGQIELSRGQYEAARGHLAAAYPAAPGQRGTRLLLGESYAAAGDLAEAARLWSGLEGTNIALAERAWWYGFLGQPERADAMRQAALLSR